MTVFEIVLIAIGLAMDAFAVAICLGLKSKKAAIKHAIVVGLYFGIFQGGMPLIGYFVAKLFADRIRDFDHWIAFALLSILGVRMILESLSKEDDISLDKACPRGNCRDKEHADKKCADCQCPLPSCADRLCPKNQQLLLTPLKLLPFAIATSIDALAVGVSFAFLEVGIFLAVSIIAVITFAISMAGVKVGSIFGAKIKSKAELVGGAILILMGTKILLEHLFF